MDEKYHDNASRSKLDEISIGDDSYIKITWMNEIYHTDDICAVHQGNMEIYFPYVKVTWMNEMYDGDDMCVVFLILLYNVHCPV